MRNARGFEALHDHLQGMELLLVGLADHHGRVAARQRRHSVILEFDRAWTIEQRELIAEKLDAAGVEFDAHAVGLSLW